VRRLIHHLLGITVTRVTSPRGWIRIEAMPNCSMTQALVSRCAVAPEHVKTEEISRKGQWRQHLIRKMRIQCRVPPYVSSKRRHGLICHGFRGSASPAHGAEARVDILELGNEYQLRSGACCLDLHHPNIDAR